MSGKTQTQWIRLHDHASSQWVTLNRQHIVSHGRFASNGFAIRMTNGTTFLATQREYTRFLKHLTP